MHRNRDKTTPDFQAGQSRNNIRNFKLVRARHYISLRSITGPGHIKSQRVRIGATTCLHVLCGQALYNQDEVPYISSHPCCCEFRLLPVAYMISHVCCLGMSCVGESILFERRNFLFESFQKPSDCNENRSLLPRESQKLSPECLGSLTVCLICPKRSRIRKSKSF